MPRSHRTKSTPIASSFAAIPLFATLAALVLGPPVSTAAAEADYASTLIRDVPHVRQKPDFCGEACVEMFLRKLNKRGDQDFVFDQSGLDPLEGRGCYTRELHTALKRIGFAPGPVWYSVQPSTADAQLEQLFAAVHSDLAQGVPSILCMRYSDRPNTTEHFRLILGYDAKSDEVIYHEPAESRGAYRRMKREMLLKIWPLKYANDEWTVIRFRLQPQRVADGERASTPTNADFAQRVRELKAELAELKTRQESLQRRRDEEILAQKEREADKLKAWRAAEAKRKAADEARRRRDGDDDFEPSRPIPRPRPERPLKPRIVSDFQIVVQEPFLVVGDESLADVSGWAQGTIAWAVRQLKSQYFAQDPDHVITIWLFKDKQSYEQNLYDIFRRRPHTPYGYYSSSDRALVMNINTGGGTLVHEIVHPFMSANFPDCPSWFNEGLASLYEQCHERNGKIWGLVNWRLRGLRRAIENEDYEMPTFKELCATSTREFYDEDPGTNYAQARYLCLYLQEKGLLRKYYHQFVANAKDDAGGYKTLQSVLGEEDMEDFQKRWTEFVLQLQP